ncbi:hypothetical protein CHLNCDRAFT_142582 [Chlorella variabilis]|uniref:Uncharacterized protein n=1 Tax=Chlorella variabilis TaxID=554065 RepID=E1ZTY2_CHLVA|nr:hypothetical protein CHLNCDRAFT_142582 [Chlorella variabilis]EFN50720.1 hypothetical protein CHLNCDRAFT_142582 [Chlorella variabilis]|eukprot:XP_005842832.1 hypothetical protein CHLNCDRAFT_142582 [Chlorella variabilis]
MAGRGRHRRLLQNVTAAGSGNTYIPAGGRGTWEAGGTVPVIFLYANLMKNGDVVGWSNTAKVDGKLRYPTATYRVSQKGGEEILVGCGIADCKNTFCSAQTTTADNEVFIFGGHGDKDEDEDYGMQAFRSYNHGNGTLWSGAEMGSGRWYPSVLTLADGSVLVVGGVKESSQAGYVAEDREDTDNPTYTVYDPKSRSFGGDQWEMEPQLTAAWPVHTYPHLVLLPDGKVAVSSGTLLMLYQRTGPFTFDKVLDLPPRPGAPWSYPQTGLGLPLPIASPYKKVVLLAAGGSAEDRADPYTPASDTADLIDLTGGANATWRAVGPMPYSRVMGDAVILCDGTIGLFGGAATGKAGWSNDDEGEPVFYEFKDGSTYDCEERCTLAHEPYRYEPTIFDPVISRWSAAGSQDEPARPRLYHSVHLLLPDCRVLAAASEVTNDTTAEIFSPPYLNLGPRPVITSFPDSMLPGDDLNITYTSADPVTKAILIRTGVATHSMAFDARALWLNILSNVNGTLSLDTPANSNLLPPGMYMLVLLSSKGAPSEGKILSIYSVAATPDLSTYTAD